MGRHQPPVPTCTHNHGLSQRKARLGPGVTEVGTIGAGSWTWTGLSQGARSSRSPTDGSPAIPGWNGEPVHYWKIDIAGVPSVSTRVNITDMYPPVPGFDAPIDRVTAGLVLALGLNAIGAVVKAKPGAI